MTMSQFLLSALFLLSLVPALPSASSLQTADDVIEKHLAAVGGRAALAKLTSRKSTGTVTIDTPNGSLPGTIEIYAKAPNKTRAYMTLDLSALGVPDKMVVEQKFDGAAGWTLNSMQGNSAIAGNQLQNMRNNVFPSPLLDYKTAGTKIEVLPKEKVAGKEAIGLLLTPKEGSVVRMFFDAETYLLVRAVVKISTPELGEFEQTNDPSDYRSVDGIKVPFVVTNTSSVQTLTIRLEKVEHNVAIDDAMFVVKSPIAAAAR
jgi:outer membrane lipoprotein-sorting protein